MPATTQCSLCSRIFPVRAQMNLSGGEKIPMLVVLQEVDNVEKAIAVATCQVCLQHQGETDRGLYKILKGLGLKDEEDDASPPREVTIVIPSRVKQTASIDAVVSCLRPCRDDYRPALQVNHLTGAIGDSAANQAALAAAREQIRIRDEACRLERVERFGKLMHWLKLTLAKISKRARTQEIWYLVETFECKLAVAASLDGQQRGKRGLLVSLGTSAEGLDELCQQFYQSRKRVHIRNREIVTVDAFEGGQRPESWDLKGGKRPAFYQFEVVRTKSTLPVPNSPLPDADESPCPRIVYPEGGKFGSIYAVEISRRDATIDMICNKVTRLLAGWLAAWHVKLGIGPELSKFDLTAHIPDFFVTLRDILAQESVEELAEQANQADEPATTFTPAHPATT